MSKKKRAKTSLYSVDHSEWVFRGKLPAERAAKLRIYASRFVLDCEALGSTRQTEGFIKDLKIYTTQRVRSFVKTLGLNESVLYEAKNSPEELGALLVRDNLADDEFANSETCFVYFTFSGLRQVVKQVNGLAEFKVGAAKKTGTAKQNKSEFYRLDALFRHLRNSIAHGQFSFMFHEDGEVYWAFQDSNAKGKITSRMVLSESLLDDWVHELCVRDRRYK